MSDPLTTKVSPRSVDDTVTVLTGLLDARGVKVFGVIDHSGEARDAGLELRDTKVVIFGNPRAGTPIMETAPEIALELPLKVLVWRDGLETKLTYVPPAELVRRYGLTPEQIAPLAVIDAVTDATIAAPRPAA